jgi:hypothetical protein
VGSAAQRVVLLAEAGEDGFRQVDWIAWGTLYRKLGQDGLTYKALVRREKHGDAENTEKIKYTGILIDAGGEEKVPGEGWADRSGRPHSAFAAPRS